MGEKRQRHLDFLKRRGRRTLRR